MSRDIGLYLFEMQESQRAWAKANFGEQTPSQMMMGVLGELGELAESLLRVTRSTISRLASTQSGMSACT